MLYGTASVMAVPADSQPSPERKTVSTTDNTERDQSRAEELALAIAAKGGCMDSFEQLVSRF